MAVLRAMTGMPLDRSEWLIWADKFWGSASEVKKVAFVFRVSLFCHVLCV